MPEHFVKAVRIMDKLYEARETVKRLYGDRAMAELKPYMDLIQSVHKGKGVPVLSVGMEMAKALVDADKSPLMVLAAVVEILEPSGNPIIKTMEAFGVPVSDATRSAAARMDQAEDALRRAIRPEEA